MPPANITSKPGVDARLPDPDRRTGPFKPFASDPGRDEVWWWLAIPAFVAVGLVAIYTVSEDFYAKWIHPEGYGFLELGQFIIAATGMIIALRLLFRPYVRARRLVFGFCCLAALSCFYIAGEEHSWGQHFFHWQTPEYWAQINRQQETNLHNTLHLFGKKPRVVLELGILTGGLTLPLLAHYYPVIRANRWSLFIPPGAILPIALGAALFKGVDAMKKTLHIPVPVQRPSEVTEFYLYLFLLFYLIMFTRRINELEREGTA